MGLGTNHRTLPQVGASAAALVLAAGLALAQSGGAALDRTVLPVQEPPRPFYTEIDVRSVKAPPAFKVEAPAGAPNVIIVLIDDLGFGATSTFGGPIATPTSTGSPRPACATTTSTRPRCARRRGPPSRPAATTTP